jgi:hypothetical protein|tara:strand:+ start:133 stop:411 length:279 start_codon:yes stop_codon:yes gene_type:complete
MTRYHATANGNVPFTAEEEAERDAEEAAWAAGANDRLAAEEREKRNALLAETDYFGASDVTMSSDMTAYRQALRDVPQQTDFPTSINWPTKP